MAGYSGTPLPRKLGIREGSVVALVGAPAAFVFDALPHGARVRRSARGEADLALAFARTRAELARRWDAATRCSASVWIAWPKQSSALAGELTENVVRDHGLARGWVDFKVVAIDDTWSGLRFARRRS
jgi:hypothetical protein